MNNYTEYLLYQNESLKQALLKMDKNSIKSILFVVDFNNKLIGSLTYGDIRRALVTNADLSINVKKIISKNPRFINKENIDIKKIIDFKKIELKLIPVVNNKLEVIDIINFEKQKSFLPIDTIIMAGGKGLRLRPLTDKTPKPLLKINNAPIIDYIINHLKLYGLNNIWVSINYLGEKIKSHLGDGTKSNINLTYIEESKYMGTIGSVTKIDNFKHDFVLLLNSDLLCDIDFEIFFSNFILNDADISIVSLPYNIKIPYGVINLQKNKVKSLIEKPTYTYQSNGGIYLIKKHVLKIIPEDTFYNATDLIEKAITKNFKVINYPFSGNWIDIGNPIDYKRAKEKINQFKF